MSVSAFPYGGLADPIRILQNTPYAATDNVIDPGTATASLTFRTDGDVRDQDNVSKGNWIDPAAAASSDWEIRVTANPDTPDAGVMNTWLAMSVNRTWTESRSGFGTDSKTMLVEFRKNGGAVRGSANFTLTADVDI